MNEKNKARGEKNLPLSAMHKDSIAYKWPDLVTPLYIEAPLEKPLLFLQVKVIEKIRANA